jgi:hypothetical protein
MAGGVSAAVAPSATASTVYLSPVYGNRVLIVELTHSETVLAAQLGAGHVINGVMGNDRWGPILDNDSAYRGANPPRPFRARAWNTVTGQQVIAEAASHPGGRVVFGVFPDNPDVPLWVMQDW